VFSSKSAERLSDVNLEMVYIPLPRPRMRSAHVSRGRGLNDKMVDMEAKMTQLSD